MSNTSHLDNVDFIKGLAAISVIFLHTLPLSVLKGTAAVFHIWQAVPIFIFISFFLSFRNLEKKEDVFKGYYSKDRFKKIFLRIWLPLLILAVLEAVFFLVIGNKERAISSLLCYGNGPGGYYVWCYMQIWLLMPAIYLLIKRYGIVRGGGILLIISYFLDFLWERYIDLDSGYTCFRYLFLSVPAYIYLKGINTKSLLPIAIFSIIYLVLMIYSSAPFYFDPVLPDGWEAQTGLGYFYTLALFIIVSKLYKKLKVTRIKTYITLLGTISWEIFLVQMVLIGCGFLNIVSSWIFDSAHCQIFFKDIVTLPLSLLLAKMYKNMLVRVIQVN